MKNKWMKIAGAAVAAIAMTASVKASPITGSISITGNYNALSGANGTGSVVSDLTTAHSMVVTGNFNVFNTAGNFVGANASTVTFASPINVNPANNLIPNVQLWSVVAGGVTYTFTVNTESQTAPTSGSISLSGTGTFADGIPGDSVGGTFQLGFGADGTVFSFQNNNSVGVPDGGTTAMLLGSAMIGLGLLKKKLFA